MGKWLTYVYSFVICFWCGFETYTIFIYYFSYRRTNAPIPILLSTWVMDVANRGFDFFLTVVHIQMVILVNNYDPPVDPLLHLCRHFQPNSVSTHNGKANPSSPFKLGTNKNGGEFGKEERRPKIKKFSYRCNSYSYQ